MRTFILNNTVWLVQFVDKRSYFLTDRRGNQTKACTNPISHKVFIANNLSPDEKRTVLLHELAHCVMVSYNLLDDVHRMTKDEYYVDMEEFICNIIANHSSGIQYIADDILRTGIKFG